MDDMGGCCEPSDQLGRSLESATGSAQLLSSGQPTTPYSAHKNLHQWLSTEQSCGLCGTTNATLQHVLSGYKTALTQGRFRWRHEHVLRKLAEVVDERRQEANRDRPRGNQQSIHFLRQGEAPQNTDRRPAPNLLTLEAEWRNGGGPGKAAPINNGDQQHHVTARHGAVEVCTANRAHSGMVRGAGGCL